MRFSQQPQTPVNRNNKCNWCGKTPIHPKTQCPAREAVCHGCQKKGHYQSVCRNSVKKIESIQEDIFLGAVHTKDALRKKITLTLNSKSCVF